MTKSLPKKVMTEAAFQRKVKADLDKLYNCHYIKIQQVGRNGDPDIVATVSGYSVHIELKREGKNARKLQKLMLLKNHKALGFSFVADITNWSDILKFLIFLGDYGNANRVQDKYLKVYNDIIGESFTKL